MAINDIVMGAAGASGPATYIEDVFSTYIYTGDGGTSGQTIVNNIDLSTYSGIVWIKPREFSGDNKIFATGSGDKYLVTNATSASTTIPSPYGVTFNANGFYARDNFGTYDINAGGTDYASWTFREQPKFFDVVTYTGNSTARTIAHNLGSVPGCIIVKRTDFNADWQVYHRSLANTDYIVLNSTAAVAPSANRWNNTTPTDTVFSLGAGPTVNLASATYVAYLFAHDAGGFGATGTDNVISCGSFTTDGSGNATVNLGYEPQWVLIKSTDNSDSWFILDNMRGWVTGGNDSRLLPNSSVAEQTASNYGNITATGFQAAGSYYANSNHIYIAIRRPMKTPTTGTEVFSPVARTGTGTNTTVTTNIVTDALLSWQRTGNGYNAFFDRLRGTPVLGSATTAAEANVANLLTGFDLMNGVKVGTDANQIINSSGFTFVNWALRRAPGFFDVVCYTGTGANATQTHNLGVIPELLIVKNRTASGQWFTYSSGTTIPNNYYLLINSTAAQGNAGTPIWNNTSTTFLASTDLGLSTSSRNYVAYLFATVAGVSKVGSYTGTGATLNINAGFTTGARFVMIKRTDDVGDWFVWDTARGMVAGTDPRLAMNSTAAESNANWVYTASSGFQIVTTDATVNASGGSYIYLAIA